jgi:hypothetical protein
LTECTKNWGDAGFAAGAEKAEIAAEVRAEYGSGQDGYTAFVADYGDQLGADMDPDMEDRAHEVAEEIFFGKYS